METCLQDAGKRQEAGLQRALPGKEHQTMTYLDLNHLLPFNDPTV